MKPPKVVNSGQNTDSHWFKHWEYWFKTLAPVWALKMPLPLFPLVFGPTPFHQQNRPDFRIFRFFNFFLKKTLLFQRFPLSQHVLRISEPCFEFPKVFFLDSNSVHGHRIHLCLIRFGFFWTGPNSEYSMNSAKF